MISSDLPKCIDAVQGGHAICFLGSGFSSLAKNAEGSFLPTGQKLNKLLLGRLGAQRDYDLDITAREYQERFGEHALLNLLNGVYTAVEVSTSQSLIVSQPWYRYYTTNYDNVIRLCSKQYKPGSAFEISARIPKSAEVKIVFLNGDLSKGDIRNFSSGIKLSRGSYLTDTFLDTPWHSFFKNDLSLCSAVVFFGYSMYDIDVARIVYRDPMLKHKTFFVDVQDLDPVFARELEQYGTVFDIGLDRFSYALQTHQKSSAIPAQLSAFDRLAIPNLASAASGSDVLALVMHGEIEDRAIIGSRASQAGY